MNDTIPSRRILYALALILSVGTISNAPSSSAFGAEQMIVSAPSPMMRLISGQEYRNVIADVFGPDIDVSTRFPAFRRIAGLSELGSVPAMVTPAVLAIFDAGGRSVATQVVSDAHRTVLIPCVPRDPKLPDENCARKFLGEVGHLLFRRPMTSDELNTYVSAAHSVGEKSQNFYTGIASALSGMLISPKFLYLIESTEPNPERPGELRLDGPSKALRLSLLLWNSTPDEELSRAAITGELHTSQGLRRQVERMLASSRLTYGVRAFFEDMLILDNFDDVVKDPVIYPAYSLKVAAEAREQMLRLIVDDLITRHGDYRDLFTTRNISLTRALGPLYQVPVSAPGPLDWVAYEIPETSPRAGILTQVGFLSVNAHPGRSSATRRGKAIREIFMCQKVPDPPPNVDFSKLENPQGLPTTARQRMELHVGNPVCAGCHKITDPIGVPLENFDGAGQYRADENGVKIDPSGSLGAVHFADARGLGQALHDDSAVPSCLVQKLFEYGLSRAISNDDKPAVADLQEQFKSDGYRFVELLRSLANSDVFLGTTGDHPRGLLQSARVQ
jgi:hypothetical protein